LKKAIQKYKLKIQSDSSNLELIRQFIYDVAVKSGFSNEEANKLELAVDEACSNVVRHAYTDGVEKGLEIETLIKKDRLIIKIKDKGKGFDPEAIRTPDMKEYLAKYKIGGLGIHIINTLVDRVDFKINPGIKNEVILTKYFESKGEKVER